MDNIPADSLFLNIESAANSGAFGVNSIPEPTDAQKLAGNYKMGRFNLHGLSIAIEQPRNSYRTGVGANGKRWVSRMAAHYGYVVGTKGADGDGVDVFVGPYPQSESAYVINQHWDGRFDEHKVMLAFPDEESARRAYMDSYDKGWKGLHSLVACSVSQLTWWLKNSDLSRPILAKNLPYEGLEDMNQKLAWDENAAPIGATLHRVLYDVRRNDKDGLLLDSVTASEILDDADSVMTLDALVVPFVRLERQMEILRGVMERSGGDIKPVAVQITEPFKQRGTANVAALFELSDGQTVSIFFHNPDVTPGTIAPADELVSWKWMLNKKDITIVVAPERGHDLNVREVARRIMALAEKNSEAFKRANSKRGERMQAIQGLKFEITGLEAELTQAQKDLEVARVQAEGKSNATGAAPIAPQAPNRLEWEESVYGEIESGWDMTRSDAQGLVEARTDALEAEWAKKSNPEDAARAVMESTEQPITPVDPAATVDPDETLLVFAQKTRRALQGLGYEEADAGTLMIRRDGDFTLSVKTSYEGRSIVGFMVTVLKSGAQQHDAIVQVDLSSGESGGPTDTANKINAEAVAGMTPGAAADPAQPDGEGAAAEQDKAQAQQSPTDEQLRNVAEAGAEVGMTARNDADPENKDGLPLATLRHPTDETQSIALWTELDVTRARNAVNEAETQMSYAAYDAGAIRMPTAVQLGLNTMGKLRLFEYEGKLGWTNGHILDMDRPKLVTDAIAKYHGDDSGAVSEIAANHVERVVSSAVSSAKTKVEPMSEHNGSELKVTTSKGNEYRDVKSIVLIGDDGNLAVKADRKYFAYFEKKYKGPEFLASMDGTGPIVIRKGGEVVGVMMPINAASDKPLDIARRAKRASERVASPEAGSAPSQSAVERVDAAFAFDATAEFKEWLADSVASEENSPFSTAKGMTMRAAAAGASIQWGFLGGVVLDDVGSEVCSDQTSLDESWGVAVIVVTGPAVPENIDEPVQELIESTRDVALDAVGQSAIVGKINKDGVVVGRVDMDSAGHAIVYVGEDGTTPVDQPNGSPATRSFTDAPYMIDWVFLQFESEKATQTDPNTGREWDSVHGRQRIARRLVSGAGDMYEVQTVDKDEIRRYRADAIEEVIKDDEHKLTPEYAAGQEQAAELRRIREENEAREIERQAQVDGEIAQFTAGMTAVSAGKARAALLAQVKSNGSITTRKGLVEDRIAQGYTVDGESGSRRLESADGAGLDEKQITKTAMDYAAFLLARKAADLSNVAPTAIPLDDIRAVMTEMTVMDVADGWIVMNAPRPLLGDKTGSGDFLTGRFYAAIDMNGDNAERFIAENRKLDAVIVIQGVTRARQMAAVLVDNEYQASYMEMPEDERSDALQSLISDLYGIPYGDLLKALARGDEWAATPAVAPAAEPAPAVDPAPAEVSEDAFVEVRGFLKSFTDGAVDVMDSTLADRLEKVKTDYADNEEIMALWGNATRAYVNQVMQAASGALAGVGS